MTPGTTGAGAADPAQRNDPLRSLAAWDAGEPELARALSRILGAGVHFAGGPLPLGGAALFSWFDREPLAAFSRDGSGGITLPGGPHAAYQALVEERWLVPSRPLHTRLPLPYPPLPGAARQWLAGWLGRAEGPAEAGAPGWPVEGRVDTFRLGLHSEMLTLGHGGSARPERNPWPGGKRFAFALTLDADTARGQAGCGAFVDGASRLGVPVTPFLVGEGYRWDAGLCAAVAAAGGEVGLHGTSHRGDLPFATPAAIARALDRCRPLLESHGVRGFRAPYLLDSEALLRAVGARFLWDSSCPDTDVRVSFAARRGCATVFPCRRHGTLTLPVTLPQDDRLLQLGYSGLDLLGLLRTKVEHVRAMGGLALLTAHPEPHLAGHRPVRDLYLALCREVVEAGDAWVTTPSAVAAHWRSLEPERLPGVA